MNKQHQNSLTNNDISTSNDIQPSSPPPLSSPNNIEFTNLSTSQYLNIINEETNLKKNNLSHRGSQISLSSHQRTSLGKKASEGAAHLLNNIPSTLGKAETTLSSSPSLPNQAQSYLKDSSRNSFTDVESLKREQQQQQIEKRHRKSIFQKLKLIRRKRVDQQNTVSTDIDENNDEDDDDDDDYDDDGDEVEKNANNNGENIDDENNDSKLKNPFNEDDEDDDEENEDENDVEIDDNFVMNKKMEKKRETLDLSNFNEDYEEDEATEENDNLNSLCDLDEEVFNKISKNPTNQIENNSSLNTNKRTSIKSTSSVVRSSLSIIKKSPTLQTPRSPITITNKSIAKPSSLQPIKTILSNSNSNLGNLNGTGSRQSVSFLDEKLKSSKEIHYDNTKISLPLPQNESNILLLQKQESAPASCTMPTAISCISAITTTTTVPNSPDFLKMGGLNLNSSFTSSALSSSYSPSLLQAKQQQQPNSSSLPQSKVLRKAMTQGSKAMRIMGNDSENMMNGPLNKNSASTGALSFKSSSSHGSKSNSAIVKKQQQKRLFFKNGNINISRSNIKKRRRRYITDLFTTLIDLKWRYNLIIFFLGFLISWTSFAIIWYLISYFRGDLNTTDENHVACIQNLRGFAGAILFSIETQQTIGYGARFTTEKCPEAILVMMVQSSVGVIIQSFMVGIVFAKLSRPKKRSETLMFSKNAVISLRDGRLCLICRVGDMRKSHIVEAHVRMYLIKKKVSLEGEIMPLHMYDLNVGWDKGTDRLFLVWPLTIEHYIDQNSPFWNISAEELKKERFELAVILEGIVESTGMTTQARSSYLANEILWGHRFEKLITFQKGDGTYKIDYSRFDMTVPFDTPTCSAKDLAELKEQEQEQYFSETFNEDESSGDSPTNTNNSNKNKENDNPDLRKRKTSQQSNAKENEAKSIYSSNNIRMIIEDHSNRNDFALNQKDMIDFEETVYNKNENDDISTGETSFIKNNANGIRKGELENSAGSQIDHKYSIRREDDSSEHLIIV